jgi:hypothetical protein
MQDDEGIIAIVILFDHLGYLFLVLNRQIRAIKELCKFDHLVEDPLLEWGHRSDTLVGLAAHLRREILVIKVGIHFESVDKTLLGDIPFGGVDHGEGTACANDQDPGDLLVNELV